MSIWSVRPTQHHLRTHKGVRLPLHISLSRPLTLRAEHKDDFEAALRRAISTSTVQAFHCQLDAILWHPNESGTRWFLVLRTKPREKDELGKLLAACNGVAEAFGQPLLYAEFNSRESGDEASREGNFHISIAWALNPPSSREGRKESVTGSPPSSVQLTAEAKALRIPFTEIKLRIGQTVMVMPLPAARSRGTLFA
ncbi:hypothetical protein BAUCODRAFT_35124 [Baudoinia panamericana UAMH 10762]|uniref:U6 snRNA phosphodiesterase 1 n=1 Tax=Baudoinia panamericana (strain UAMH 10762) TaxID=717646 RepID=M2LLH4_BAUPA|nr:uncharacterized protein BAUCODRAFT_35124 [Baudoinia panamericana UAMH 10762]EMC95132.1 hypothetical protein BAUCODRAFT_35124 [Baudoinia panamericana UAMH 10762]